MLPYGFLYPHCYFYLTSTYSTWTALLRALRRALKWSEQKLRSRSLTGIGGVDAATGVHSRGISLDAHGKVHRELIGSQLINSPKNVGVAYVPIWMFVCNTVKSYPEICDLQ